MYNGGSLRHFHLIHQLAQRHCVTLLVTAPVRPVPTGFPPSPLASICVRIIQANSRELISPKIERQFHAFAPLRWRLWNLLTWWRGSSTGPWLSPGVVRLFRGILADVRPDVVWADQSYIAEAVRAAGFIRIVVDMDDIQTVYRYRDLRTALWYNSKPLHYLELAKLAAYEWSLSRRLWRVVVCKEEDRKFVGGNRSRVFVVPNGVEPVPAMDPANEVAGQMFFVGSLDYPPNADAVQFFAAAILPQIRQQLPGATFHIAGKRPDGEVSRLHDGWAIFMHGTVPSVDPHYLSASLFVSPLRMGAGTKLKILEALVRGKGVVATSQSVEGLNLIPGVHFMQADTPNAFATVCVHLLNDAGLRSKLGAAGRVHVLRHFTWDRVGELADLAVQPHPWSDQTTFRSEVIWH